MSSGNPVAIASAAAGMASSFPMINPNAIATQMVAGALSGAGFDIASKLPNLSLSPDGIMKMMPIPGKLPTKDAKPPIKTAAPPKPVKPVELKNLFAEGAAAGSVSDLMKPLSQAMSIASTIASAASIAKMVTSSPAATSYGTQKLTTNANTINWGSNSSRPNTAKLAELGVHFTEDRPQLVAGFIDCNCLETCRVAGGPRSDGPDSDRWSCLIQQAFYNGWKSIHGIKPWIMLTDLPWISTALPRYVEMT
jgi:hypothetical protein